MDTFYTPARQIFFFTQLFSTYFTAYSIVFSYLDYLVCIRCVLSMFKHLNLKLDKLKHFKTRSSRKVQIKNCVIYHLRIIKLSNTLNSAYKNATISIFIAPVMLSVIIFQILSGGNHIMYNVIHMIIWLLVLISSCATGESMIEHSLSIVNAAYDSIPFDGDTESQKDIILIIRRASRPLTLNIGSFSDFTNPFALSTFKFSYTVTTYLVQK
ncbi:PREDICTED: uncharacterized protein LOC108567107 isoform X2 [Nicrophorus vespilloides]|uniref:Uncharacterized protein LOC108567107 isoform X2 n=1 Tax=Nicrophorus vespilloides TaxID=110193 RepID=A0ABM1N7R5_NICVS|nr:PREDICTED: uncharacterized protein LOC108567107 isoform X2 [Nicrophorus vespilloides]